MFSRKKKVKKGSFSKDYFLLSIYKQLINSEAIIYPYFNSYIFPFNLLVRNSLIGMWEFNMMLFLTNKENLKFRLECFFHISLTEKIKNQLNIIRKNQH